MKHFKSEDTTLIKNLWESKKSSARRLIKGFPIKLDKTNIGLHYVKVAHNHSIKRTALVGDSHLELQITRRS